MDQLAQARHTSNQIQQIHTALTNTGLTHWPFSEQALIPEHFYVSQDETDLLAADRHGRIWLNDDSQRLYNLSDPTLSIWQNGPEDPDPQKSWVLGFGANAVFIQSEQKIMDLKWSLRDTDLSYYGDVFVTVDDQDRIWFYHPEQGLVVDDHGSTRVLGRLPDGERKEQVGVLPGQHGRVWVGDQGAIWAWDQGRWQKLVGLKTDQHFTHLAEDTQGVLYAATGEGVYQIDGDTFTEHLFVEQSRKPVIRFDDDLPENVGPCVFNRRYTKLGICPESRGKVIPEYNYQVRYLGVQPDGSVIYINNRIIARLKDNQWRSFAFDTFTIESAAVDGDGNIWILSNAEGVMRFAPTIFDDYAELILSKPTETK